MAQLVERYVRNVQATSSNLVISTKIKIPCFWHGIFILVRAAARTTPLKKRNRKVMPIKASVHPAAGGTSSLASEVALFACHFWVGTITDRNGAFPQVRARSETAQIDTIVLPPERNPSRTLYLESYHYGKYSMAVPPPSTFLRQKREKSFEIFFLLSGLSLHSPSPKSMGKKLLWLRNRTFHLLAPSFYVRCLFFYAIFRLWLISHFNITKSTPPLTSEKSYITAKSAMKSYAFVALPKGKK